MMFTNPEIGIIQLASFIVIILLGFPIAFTLVAMGVFFGYYAMGPRIFNLLVTNTYDVMSNDVLTAVPLFLFMGYVVERSNILDRLFYSIQMAMRRVPGSLAVATLITCALFATATGIVGAVVTLMGLLAFPAMLKAGYNIKVSAGALTAGGCLGILIPPSVLLIVYGATAGVSVVQLYAGAFFPGFMLASLYIGYIIVLAKWKPSLMPPLPESERRVPLPPRVQPLAARGGNALAASWRALVGQDRAGVARRTVFAQFLVSLLPALAIAAVIVVCYRIGTAPEVQASTAGLVEAGGAIAADASASEQSSGLIGAPAEEETQDQQKAGELAPPPGAEAEKKPAAEAAPAPSATAAPAAAAATRVPAPTWFYVLLGIGIASIFLVYWLWSWERLQVFKLLLTSFFPLALLILAVLGSIVVGLATPAEAAAVGAFGGFVLAWIYRFITHWRERPAGASAGKVLGRTTREFGRLIKESCFLTAKTSAMVCWLFVGSGIFSAAFALLGGQELIEKWVLSLDMTPLQFMILAQFIIFILGWPLEWTEIIIIFMPIFIPLLPHFTPAGFTPDQFALFFGLLVALNLQTAFLSPPVAMAAFYLKGVSPPHVTLNQIFAGMMPFMGIQVLAIVLLYMFPQIGLWLPSVFYAR